MRATKCVLRALIVAIAAAAVLAAPVVRAFAESLPIPRAAAIAPGRAGDFVAHAAHRMPRVRRPKQSLLAVLPSAGPLLPPVPVSRRAFGADDASPPPSLAVLPEHPPA